MADLVDGKADGLHVFALPSLFPVVLLHEADQEAAVGLAGSVGMLQDQLELGVQPEGGCKEEKGVLPVGGAVSTTLSHKRLNIFFNSIL